MAVLRTKDQEIHTNFRDHHMDMSWNCFYPFIMVLISAYGHITPLRFEKITTIPTDWKTRYKEGISGYFLRDGKLVGIDMHPNPKVDEIEEILESENLLTIK